MSKPPKKWTKWIPHTGDECPVNGAEVVKYKLAAGCQGQCFAATIVWGTDDGHLRTTHYKRLRANVEGEERARHLAYDLESLKDRPPNRRGPFVITDADLGIAEAPRTSKLSGKFDKAPPEPFQARVKPWLETCFGPEISADRVERNHRFLEEALELVQACGCTAHEAHQLVDYVFERPQGEINQEAGGVMVTLAAHCLAHGIDMHEAGEKELARVWTKVETIRAKQAAKPKHSPLPGPSSPEPTPIITGPGEYKTRDGGKVKLLQEMSDHWVGEFMPPARCRERCWYEFGKYLRGASSPHRYDIIGPWEEPEAEPEEWVSLYKKRNGELWLGAARVSTIEDERTPGDEGSGYVGSVLLTKGEG